MRNGMLLFCYCFFFALFFCFVGNYFRSNYAGRDEKKKCEGKMYTVSFDDDGDGDDDFDGEMMTLAMVVMMMMTMVLIMNRIHVGKLRKGTNENE